MSALQEYHPSIQHLLDFFAYRHLPEELQEVSKSFSELAFRLAQTLPPNPETTVALRKLLEAKDCAVRSRMTELRKASEKP